jgi:hypothetical protein
MEGVEIDEQGIEFGEDRGTMEDLFGDDPDLDNIIERK